MTAASMLAALPGWAAGRTLGEGRFLIGNRLGTGSFGEVFEAYDRKLGCSVALKRLLRVGPGEIYDFKREFRRMASVHHDNLVVLYELFADDGQWFFTMELVRGHSLSDYLHRVRVGQWADAPERSTDRTARAAGDAVGGSGTSGRCKGLLSDQAVCGSQLVGGRLGGVRRSVLLGAETETQTLDPAYLRSLMRVMAQICAGVAALHDAGMIHRDLAPSNVRVTPADEVKIVDFGLVTRTCQSDGCESGISGTPLYMSPEQALAADELTPKSDWYAVGAMLYEALVGAPIFAEVHTTLRKLRAKTTRDPHPPSTRVDGIPPELDRLCLQLLQRDPSDRPSRETIMGCFDRPVPPRLTDELAAAGGA